MPRTDFPDWPSNGPPPSQRLPTLQQRWWWSQTSRDEITILDEHGCTVAAEMDADTARHIVQTHNNKIGASR
jgi:hypothetical protein|tara:strand:- start:81 stop:296 length:216 start_codon:yes stop_codon:yes gene_type:complete